MFDAAMVVGAEVVIAKAVCFGVANFFECSFEGGPLCRVDIAFEDGILDADSVVEALACDVAQAAASRGRNCGNIIADKDHHREIPF